MKIEIRPPFKLDKEAWENLKRATVYALAILAGLTVIAIPLSYLLYWLTYLPEPYEGGL
jgi:hypothetical protein